MKPVLKWVGISAGVLAGLALLGFGVVYMMSQSVINKNYEASTEAVAPSGDPGSIERGRYLATAVMGCSECHGEDLGGAEMMDDPAIGTIDAPNLTSGKNGVGRDYRSADWERAIRHGVSSTGKGLFIMPSKDWETLRDDNLADLIAFLKSVPAADSDAPRRSVGPIGRVLLLNGGLPKFAAEDIAFKESPGSDRIQPSDKEYGEYLGTIAGCNGCHGKDLKGGPVPGSPPGTPPASNISSSGVIAGWSEEAFVKTIRSGTDPGGHKIDKFMPTKAYAKMTGRDLGAIYRYLKTR